MNQRIKTLPGCSILDGYFCLQRPLSFLILSLGGERTISENLRQLVFASAPRLERPNCKNLSGLVCDEHLDSSCLLGRDLGSNT